MNKSRVQLGKLEPNQEQLLAALRSALRSEGLQCCSVLDIGCGSGHIHLHLLQEGACTGVGVEFGSDYLEEARGLARSLGHEDRVTYLQGDFMELANQIEPADVTILDKVVHCYQQPSFSSAKSTAHTRFIYGLTYPPATTGECG